MVKFSFWSDLKRHTKSCRVSWVHLRRRKANIMAAGCFLSLIGCTYQPDVVGPNSYSISCDKGRDCAVLKSRGNVNVVVEPEVDQYNIVGQYIIGHVTQQTISLPAGVPPPATRQPSGYFIVDTKKDRCLVGLSEADWKKQLLQAGIQNSQLRNTK